MVSDWTGTLLEWGAELERLKGRLGSVFARAETRETAGAFLDGLLSGVERKTRWLMGRCWLRIFIGWDENCAR